MTPVSIESIRTRISERSPLPPERTQRLLEVNFRRVPLRTAYALDRLPLARSRVLDVGCSYGTSLIHFGEGSVGLDNSQEAVAFCQGIGLDARLVDVETGDMPDGTFDYLWVSDIVEHLEAPRKLLRRLIPLAGETGSLVVQLSVLPTSVVARRALRARGKQPFDADVHYHQWTRATFAHLLRRAGWRTEKVLVPHPPQLARVRAALVPPLAPRLIFVARPDARLLENADTAERRNRQLG